MKIADESTMNNRIIIAGLILSILMFAGCASTNKEFATCLTDKGVTMYGAFWCSHCQNQKKMFGSAFSEVNYVECSLPSGKGQTQVCIDKGISGYPTWELGNGTRLEGEVSLAMLSKSSGCPLS